MYLDMLLSQDTWLDGFICRSHNPVFLLSYMTRYRIRHIIGVSTISKHVGQELPLSTATPMSTPLHPGFSRCVVTSLHLWLAEGITWPSTSITCQLWHKHVVGHHPWLVERRTLPHPAITYHLWRKQNAN